MPTKFNNKYIALSTNVKKRWSTCVNSRCVGALWCPACKLLRHCTPRRTLQGASQVSQSSPIHPKHRSQCRSQCYVAASLKWFQVSSSRPFYVWLSTRVWRYVWMRGPSVLFNRFRPYQTKWHNWPRGPLHPCYVKQTHGINRWNLARSKYVW